MYTNYLQQITTTSYPNDPKLKPIQFRLQLGQTLEDLEKSTDYVSKELIWKVYFESASICQLFMFATTLPQPININTVCPFACSTITRMMF